MSQVTEEDVSNLARGNWRYILQALCPTLEAAVNSKNHVDCPIHGGKSDFRICRKKGDEIGMSYCTCGTRNGYQLLMTLNGWSFPETLKAIADLLNLSTVSPADMDRLRAQEAARQFDLKHRRQAEANEIAEYRNRVWAKAVPLSHISAKPARLYLNNRGLDYQLVSNHVRFHPAMAVRTEDGSISNFIPCLLSRVYACNGRPLTIHRTYITDDGHKASIGKAKRLMPVPDLWADLTGRVIPVTEACPQVGILGLAEGLETALAASQATGIPVWSTVSDGPMKNFIPPAWVTKLVIYADRDRSRAGILAAKQLKSALETNGWPGQIQIELPPFPIPDGKKGLDWCDILNTYGVGMFNSVA